MKKIITLFIILIFMTTSVSAAPYKNIFYNKDFFSRNMVDFTLGDLSFDVEADADKADSDKTTPTIKTMAAVTAGICVANSTTRSIADGEETLRVTYYTGGSDTLRECFFTDSSYTKGGLYTFNDITAGSLFYVGVDEEGFVQNYGVVAVIDPLTHAPVVDKTTIVYNLLSPKIDCVSSYIKDFRNKDGKVILELLNGDVYSVGDNSYTYTYDNSVNPICIYTDSFLSGKTDKAYYDDTTNITQVYPVVVLLWDGEVVAICSYSKPVYFSGNLE